MSVEEQNARVPEALERFVKQLLVSYKAVMLYPPKSAIPLENGEVAVAVLREVLREDPEVRIAITKDGFYFEDLPVFAGQTAFATLAQILYNRGVADVRFHAATTAKDVVGFLGVLRLTPSEIVAQGGFESRLWNDGVDSITITESRIQILDEAADGLTETKPTAEDVSQVLADHEAGRPVERKVLVRVVADQEALRSYLAESIQAEDKLDSVRIRELAHLAAAQPMRERPAFIRALVDAIEALDPSMQRALVVDRILPEARTDEALASLMRQMDVDEVCRMLVDGLDGGEVSKEGVARAIRNLALISMADRSEVISSAGAAMRGTGMPEDEVSHVLGMAAPSRITVREAAGSPAETERPVDAVFRLMDLAPGAASRYEDDADFEALEREARQGIGDGDILHALVALATIDPDAERWAAVMAMLESSLELLVARGEFDIAADIAEQLRSAAADEGFSVVQRSRLAASVNLLARPDDVRALSRALRVYDSDTSEHQAARRLLDLLGEQAIGALIAVLAEEQEMIARKALVEILSAMATDYIDQIGRHVADSRWYLVRNVVTVLGAARKPETIPYLSRTARHSDPRVRRETIRALSGLTDRVASEVMITMLGDEDAQNVQLAARHLGAARVQGAVPALMAVTRGEGRGNRDIACRIEAIEALGRIGSPDALSVLKSVAARRSLVEASRNREVRTAARAAVSRIAVPGGVG